MSKQETAHNLPFGRRQVEITFPNRVLFPQDAITKQELVDYYVTHAAILLPYLKNRPLTMQRFPEGIDHEGFYQKNTASYFPSWIKTVPVQHEKRVVNYVVGNNAATLAYLVNQACITFHIWLSKIDKLYVPDRMIFDLDPSGRNFSDVRLVAQGVRTLLERELGLVAFVMTTGSKGLHVWVPLKRKDHFEVVHDHAHDIARIIHTRYPTLTTLEIRKEKRAGKIFIDYLRNSFSATGVAPYAVRALPKAPVATPLHWDEVSDRDLKPQRYTLKTIGKRLESMEDPWQQFYAHARALTVAKKVVAELLKDIKQ